MAISFTIPSASLFACSMALTYRRAEKNGRPRHQWGLWTWTGALTCWWGVLEQECQWCASMMDSSWQIVWRNCCSVTNGMLLGLVVNEDVSTHHSILAMLCCCIWLHTSPWLHWRITERCRDSGSLLLGTIARQTQENTGPMVVSHVCLWKRKQILSLPTMRAFPWLLLLGGGRHIYTSSTSSRSCRKRLGEQSFSYIAFLLVQLSNQPTCNSWVGSIALGLMQHHQLPFWFGMFGCLFSWCHIREVNTLLESSRVLKTNYRPAIGCRCEMCMLH